VCGPSGPTTKSRESGLFFKAYIESGSLNLSIRRLNGPPADLESARMAGQRRIQVEKNNLYNSRRNNPRIANCSALIGRAFYLPEP